MAERDPLFSHFKIVDGGEGKERSIALVAKTREEKQKLADAPAKAEGASKETEAETRLF